MNATHAILAGSVILMLSCGSQETQQGLQDVCGFFHAKNCRISYGASASTESGSRKSITLELEDVPTYDSVEVKDFITSTAALKFVKSVGASALKEYDEITVDASMADRHTEQTFAVGDVLLADTMSRSIDEFFDRLATRQFDQIAALVDHDYVPDSGLVWIASTFERIDSIAGVLNNPRILGFALTTVKQYDLPVVNFWTRANFGPVQYANISLQVNRLNGKIQFIGVNDF